MITNLLFCISSPDVTCLHVLQAPWINALRGRGTHSATTPSRLCGLMRTCIAATRKVSHVFIYTYKLKVSGAHAPLGPTVDTPLCPSLSNVQHSPMSNVHHLSTSNTLQCPTPSNIQHSSMSNILQCPTRTHQCSTFINIHHSSMSNTLQCATHSNI